MRRNIRSFSLMLLVGILLMIPRFAYAAGTPTFAMQLNNAQATVGNEIQVTVTGNNITDLSGYEMNIDYDNTLLELKSAKSSVSGFSAVIPQTDGRHLQFVFSKLSDVSGENGTMVLATVTFKTVGLGKTTIQLKDLILVDSKLNSQTINGNANVTASIVTSSNNGDNGSNSGNDGSQSNPNSGSTANRGLGGINNPNNQGIIILQATDAKLDAITKIATFVLNKTTLESTIQQAEVNEQGIKIIKIIMNEVSGATAYKLQVPSIFLSSNGSLIQIQVVSPIASVLLSSSMFHENEITNEDIALQIGDAGLRKLNESLISQIGDRPVIDISLKSSNNTISWSNPDAPVTVSVPYSPNVEELQSPEHIVVWYLTGDGQVVPVSNGKYDATTGSVVFKTTHFSEYAIAFVQKTFNDITSLDWAKKQIEVLASKGIINGVTEQMFVPNQPVTRADFLLLLTRTLELNRSKGLGDKFADVYEDDYYDEALRIARKAGITEGVGNNLFKPHDSITREDMIVMTERALRVTKQMTSKSKEGYVKQFSDYAQISDYALSSVAALVDMGLVQGYDNAIHPKETTNRAQAAVLMYNIYSNLK
ncbi:S-layer homology domain-containing protein [Paenibacillus radicis (ex Xue et al. 2023)]|uniref:S-layer homology domain-containing protein n=1 Tax=Paenibacillus radicis (ex Xue et al. 2023) TaxID=2972489 RepID=A0ABT1YQF1_9BACL|nr:S-layer homology domain-containing protein [Paenibacillus radicis (ex Xue et al. 2023)]MCR8634215.1 S-layer homology domain-containing protein [Paenibacillus radicis (ex Xue et al. 2023)]